MQPSFSSKEYVKNLAQDLVDSFSKAGRATTPGLVGSAREKAVRSKLETLLPQVGIGTGCVIDVDDNTSRQTDVIIFEKDICPVFSINDTPESTYYPCESVIAVGEVKSTLGSVELHDSFIKIESVKRLNRYLKDDKCYRGYNSRTVLLGTEEERFNQHNKPFDQIYGFIICEKLGLTVDTFLEKCKDEIKKRPSYLIPNMVVSLNDGILVYLDSNRLRTCTDSNGADSLFFVNKHEENFQQLLSNLNAFITRGRTTDAFPFEKYIISSSNYPFSGKICSLRDEE